MVPYSNLTHFVIHNTLKNMVSNLNVFFHNIHLFVRELSCRLKNRKRYGNLSYIVQKCAIVHAIFFLHRKMHKLTELLCKNRSRKCMYYSVLASEIDYIYKHLKKFSFIILRKINRCYKLIKLLKIIFLFKIIKDIIFRIRFKEKVERLSGKLNIAVLCQIICL